MNKNKRVCIPISGACNSNCIFCMDDWSWSKFLTLEETDKQLNAAKRYGDEVTFSGLEPTLHPKLTQIIEQAKNKGFSKIGVVTNGRKFQNIEYIQSLISAGVNEFDISLHSYCDIKNDFIVGSKGAFKETIKGLINLSLLKKTNNISIVISTTVCKQNYKDIEKIIHLIEKFGIDFLVLNIIQLRQAANDNKDLTYISYSEIVNELEKINFSSKKIKVYINGLVHCLVNKENLLIGYFNGAQMNNTDENGEYIVELELPKKKSDECKLCMYNDSCDGVWSSYIDIYGWKEFKPIIK